MPRRSFLYLLLSSIVFLVNQAYANTAEIVGSTPGHFSVSNSGAAVYDVPIKLPPTIGGLAPDLSIRYNSQAGNGVLGLGWQIHGLSYKSSCPPGA